MVTEKGESEGKRSGEQQDIFEPNRSSITSCRAKRRHEKHEEGVSIQCFRV